MKIKYNEIEKSIEIKDSIESHYFILKMIMILNITNVILRLYDLNLSKINFTEIFWFVLGIISLVFLYLFFFKKSTLEKIPVEEIKLLKQKNIFWKKAFLLELNNGKTRELLEIKTQQEYSELKKTFSEIGIKTD
jgi:hypothetical protein